MSLSTNSITPFSTSDCQHQQNCAPLPFPLLSTSWYKLQWRKAEINKARTEARAHAQREVDDDDCVMEVHHSTVKGSLEDNMHDLSQLCQLKSNESQKFHLQTLIQIASYINDNGPLVATQEVANVYCRLKALTSVTSASMYETLSRHLNLTQLYIDGKAYLAYSCSNNFHKVLQTLAVAANQRVRLNTHVHSKLSGIYSDALKYLDTARDREVL